MARRKHTVRNASLAPEWGWRVKQIILEEDGSPRQISGVLKKEGISVSHQSICNIIHAVKTGQLANHTRHKLKYRYRPKYKTFPIADRASIHQHPVQADGPHRSPLSSRYLNHRGALHQYTFYDQTTPWKEI
ncbi:MAG: hypothetical protein Q4D66_03400 [Bacteroidales bacterium]|nr:hypothetical protein [Bacteroidales bacterium]